MAANTLHINRSKNKNVSIGEGGISNLIIAVRVSIGATNPAAMVNGQGIATGQWRITFGDPGLG